MSMKSLLICAATLLLGGCSLFEETPQKVIAGQRAVYQSVLVGEAHAMELINRYVIDTKKAVAYHENYIFQLDVEVIQSRDWEQQSKVASIIRAEKKRDEKLQKSYDAIDVRAEEMRAQIREHYALTLRLVGSVYNYLSTSPIEIDNMEFWIEKLDEISKETTIQDK